MISLSSEQPPIITLPSHKSIRSEREGGSKILVVPLSPFTSLLLLRPLHSFDDLGSEERHSPIKASLSIRTLKHMQGGGVIDRRVIRTLKRYSVLVITSFSRSHFLFQSLVIVSLIRILLSTGINEGNMD